MNVQPQYQPAAAAAPPPPLPQWVIEADTLGQQGKHHQLHQLLREFHHFNRDQCAKLRAEGYSSLSDLVNWKYKEIRSLLENLSNRPTTRGGQQFGDLKIKELQGLSWFLPDRSRRGLSFDLDLYRKEASEYISFAEIDSEITNDEAANKLKYDNGTPLLATIESR